MKNLFVLVCSVILITGFFSCKKDETKQIESKKNESTVIETSEKGKDTKSLLNNFIGTFKATCDDGKEYILVISDEKKRFSYHLTGNNLDATGTVSVKNSDTNTYLIFQNASKGQDVEAALMDDSIVIQNSGNSMNPYQIFEDCDSKYIEFIKK